MAYENVRIRKPNFTIVDGYFWFVDDNVDSVVVKTDDGTTAYSYPLDTTITETIKSIEYDGRNLWTMRTTDTDEITIDRWYINNYVCELRNSFVLPASASHKYSSEAFTVEHYHITFSSDEAAGQSNLSISDGSELDEAIIITSWREYFKNADDVWFPATGVEYISYLQDWVYPDGDPAKPLT